MNSQEPFSIGQFSRLVVVVASLTLVFVMFNSNQRASSQDPKQEAGATSSPEPKILKKIIPKHVPLKIDVRNLDSKRWVHDLEIEVTNTSDRPIYFLDFYVTLPEVKGSSGHTVGFWIKYGRGELLSFSTPVEKDDVPLLPGEKYVFKIPVGSAKGWDRMREKDGVPEPRKILIEFQGINFGDGTGYRDTGGTPVNIHKKTNFNQSCVPPPNRSPNLVQPPQVSLLPATFKPVNFFLEQN
jgi:hypothetical protein